MSLIPYRKTFQFSAEFPFEYVYRDAKSAQNELPNHVHDWYEFVYIYNGRGTFFIDHSFYDVEPGDIILIPGNTVHRSFPLEEDPKCGTALYFSASFVHADSLGDSFSYLQPFETARHNQSFRLTLEAEQQAEIETLLNKIHLEHMQKEIGFRQAIRLLVQHLLILVGRYVQQTWGVTPQRHHASSPLPQWMVDVLAYADANPSTDLGLNALAKHAAVTPAHFSRVFKRLTGMNVTDYVTAKRVMLAKELLRQNDCNIADIAESCGFGSTPHFHRKFKALTGMTPVQYKREQQI